MKRKVLALVIPALLAAGAAHAAEIYNKDGNKLDLYGKVDGLHYFSDDSSKDGDQTYMRVGFKGETQINDQLTGYGQWEYNVQANTTEGEGANSWTRLAFAGLKFGDYGSFDYGRNYGVLYDVEGWTDMLPEFGGDSYTYADNYMTGRANGVATYRNTDFFGLVDGLNFALQYQGKNESQSADDVNIGTNNRNNGDDIRYDNGDGFGISTTPASERLTRLEALALYTRHAAWLAFAEQHRGQLRVGKQADLAVLNQPFMTMPEDRIDTIRAVLTLVDGRIVHESPDLNAGQ